jgi:hypothetical protein
MPSRTAEFKASVESARLRLANVPEYKQKLLAGSNGNSKEARRSQRSEFTNQALDIAREIQATVGKLGNLAQRECSEAVKR